MQNDTILNRNNGVPKENKGITAMKKASKIAKKYSISDMALEEINEEIKNTRCEEFTTHLDK